MRRASFGVRLESALNVMRGRPVLFGVEIREGQIQTPLCINHVDADIESVRRWQGVFIGNGNRLFCPDCGSWVRNIQGRGGGALIDAALAEHICQEPS